MPLTTCIGGLLDLHIVEIIGADHPGSPFTELGGRQDLLLAISRRTVASLTLRTDGRFLKRDLAPLGALALAVRRDLAVIAQKTDTRAGPAVATSRRLASAVENRLAIALSGI